MCFTFYKLPKYKKYFIFILKWIYKANILQENYHNLGFVASAVSYDNILTKVMRSWNVVTLLKKEWGQHRGYKLERSDTGCKQTPKLVNFIWRKDKGKISAQRVLQELPSSHDPNCPLQTSTAAYRRLCPLQTAWRMSFSRAILLLAWLLLCNLY